METMTLWRSKDSCHTNPAAGTRIRITRQFGHLGNGYENWPRISGGTSNTPAPRMGELPHSSSGTGGASQLKSSKKNSPFFIPINKYINTPRVRVITSGRMGLTNTTLTFRKLVQTHRLATGINIQRPDR